ncbi:MAG: hypothetical protein QM765_39915 [Myxococcales bacterium]
MTDEAPSSPKKPRRWWRWLRRGLVSLGVLIALVVAAVAFVVRSLDSPWLKRHVQEAVRSAANLELDYQATHLGLTGVRIEGIVVLQPEKFRPLAKEFVRVGALEAHWTLGSLKGKEGPLLKSVSLEQVAVALVMDTTRGSTLDALSSPPDPKAPPPPPPPPPTPLSRQLAELLAKPLPVARASLSEVDLLLVLTDDLKERERLSLRGLGLGFAHDPDPAGGWKLAADLGTAAKPLDLAFERAGKGAAKMRLALNAAASSKSANATLDLKVVEQSLIPDLAIDRLLQLEALATFDPKAGKTEVSVARLGVGDGAVSAQASLMLPDKDCSPLLREAKGDIDVAGLLRRIPKGLVSIPVELQAGKLSFQVKDLLLAAMPSLMKGGSAGVDASLQGLRVSLTDLAAQAPALVLSVQAQPTKEGTGLGGHASLGLEKVQVDLGKKKVEAEGLALDLDASREGDGAWNGKLDLKLAKLANGIGATINAAGARLGLKVQALHVDLQKPLEAKGKVELDFGSTSLAVNAAPWNVRTSGLGLQARTQLAGGAPYALELDLPIEKLSLSGPGRSLTDAPFKLHVGLKETFPDLERPLRTRGVAQVGLDLGAIHLLLDVTRKAVETAEFTLTANAASLAVAKTLAPEAADYKLPWEKLALSLRSAGKLDKLFTKAPTLMQRTDLALDKLGLTLPQGAGSLERLELGLRSDGGFARHNADLELALRTLALGEKTYGDGKLTLSATVDADAPSASLKLKGGGAAGPEVDADLSASFDRPTKALSYQVAVSLAKLAVLAPLLKGSLAGVDLTSLAASLNSKGTVTGVVEAIAPDGTVKISPKPLETLVGKSRYELELGGVSWTSGDQEATVPSLKLQGALDSAEAGHHTVRGELQADSIHVASGRHEVDLGGVHDSIEVASTDLMAGELELDQRLRIATVRQQEVPDYPVGDLSLNVRAQRDREGTIRASLIELVNRAAGTSLRLDGTAELGGYRRALSLHGVLDQDLATAWTDCELVQAKGKLGLDVRVDSNDLRVFHAEAQAKLTSADVTLPKSKVTVESMDAEVPLQVDFVYGQNGFALRGQPNADAFAQMRFADQHPFHSRRSFLSIAKLTSPAGTMAPLAGNLEISRGVITLSQLELGVRKGLVTGQCALLLGKDPTIVARIRASDLESSYGEPFDGNLAILHLHQGAQGRGPRGDPAHRPAAPLGPARHPGPVPRRRQLQPHPHRAHPGLPGPRAAHLPAGLREPGRHLRRRGQRGEARRDPRHPGRAAARQGDGWDVEEGRVAPGSQARKFPSSLGRGHNVGPTPTTPKERLLGRHRPELPVPRAPQARRRGPLRPAARRSRPRAAHRVLLRPGEGGGVQPRVPDLHRHRGRHQDLRHLHRHRLPLDRHCRRGADQVRRGHLHPHRHCGLAAEARRAGRPDHQHRSGPRGGHQPPVRAALLPGGGGSRRDGGAARVVPQARLQAPRRHLALQGRLLHRGLARPAAGGREQGQVEGVVPLQRALHRDGVSRALRRLVHQARPRRRDPGDHRAHLRRQADRRQGGRRGCDQGGHRGGEDPRQGGPEVARRASPPDPLSGFAERGNSGCGCLPDSLPTWLRLPAYEEAERRQDARERKSPLSAKPERGRG